MPLTLNEIASLIKTELSEQDRESDKYAKTSITGVAIDSRKVTKGDLFVALKGNRVDGHTFIPEVAAKGAAAVMVSEEIETTLPKLRVTDTVKSLGVLAKNYRSRFQIPIISVTGSCGKTTVKEMIYSILKQAAGENNEAVLASQGNLNTDVGLPLTLLKLTSEHKMAVIEMGARQKGDIAYLMQLTEPRVSIITNAGIAHLGAFGSEQGVAEAKGEIYQHLQKDGIAIINADDKFASFWQSLLRGQQVITFGLESEASITCSYFIEEPTKSQFELTTDIGNIEISLPLLGKHNILNALAAAAGARALDISLEHIQAGLQNFKAVNRRLQCKPGLSGACIIDDSYNANPISVRAALEVLSQFSGKKIAVLADMKDLGPNALDLHREIGIEAKKLGIDQLLCWGELATEYVKGFGSLAEHFNDKQSLIKAIPAILDANTTVLVKGSLSMAMDEVVQALVQE